MATIDILPATFTQAPPDITRIRPSRGWRAVNLREVWRYRELLWFLTLRDIKLRYKQTALGVSWAVLQPLFTMGVFTVFFGKLGKLPSDGKPYALIVLAALLPWQLFAYALDPVEQQPGGRAEADHQGVLSQADRPGRLGTVGAC